jgi:hypothetical protein
MNNAMEGLYTFGYRLERQGVFDQFGKLKIARRSADVTASK